MRGIKFATLISILFLPFLSHSQVSSIKVDYSSIDSFARTIKYENDIFKLTKQLTEAYSKDIYKARSIFIWVTENIKYDYKFINKGKEIKKPDCSGTVDCTVKLKEWENDYIKSILKKGKGICDGYSRLFQKMCEIAGLKCEMVSGYARTKPYEVGNPMSVNHSWNAILLDSTYYFLDATWGSGGCIEDEETGKLLGFVKNYNEYYWLTPFKKLERNHYPENGKWAYDPNYTKEKFFDNPYYRSDIIKSIDLFSPTSGVISAKKGDTIHFKFNYPGKVNFIQINSNAFRNPSIYSEKKVSKRRSTFGLDSFALKKQRYIDFQHEDNLYEFDYVMSDNSIYYLELLFNYERVMRFKLRN